MKERKWLVTKFKRLMEINHRIAKDLLGEISFLEPENSKGAYYLFPKQNTGINTWKLITKLISEHGVVLVPGLSFGKDFEDHLRISFANVDEESLKEAFSRLKKANFS